MLDLMLVYILLLLAISFSNNLIVQYGTGISNRETLLNIAITQGVIVCSSYTDTNDNNTTDGNIDYLHAQSFWYKFGFMQTLYDVGFYYVFCGY